MSLITGSVALQYWFPDFGREPKDLDIISKTKGDLKADYFWVDSFQYILNNNQDQKCVDPNFLYTIKVSHASWDIRWDKTMHDIIFLKSKGCILDKNLYLLLLKEWSVLHGPKAISVKGTPEEFFNQYITRTVPHDELHHMVKFYNEPLHNKIRKDPNDVKTSKLLWHGLGYENQLKCALEETYVFALERYMKYPPKIALAKALKNLITSATKGYFNLFLIENFNELLYYDHGHYLKIYKEMRPK